MDGDFTSYERSRQLEGLALFHHGSLAAHHGIGVVYHYLRGSKKHAIYHAQATAYSILSLYQHWVFYRDE